MIISNKENTDSKEHVYEVSTNIEFNRESMEFCMIKEIKYESYLIELSRNKIYTITTDVFLDEYVDIIMHSYH